MPWKAFRSCTRMGITSSFTLAVEKLKDAVNALLEWGVPFHRVNDHCPANVAKYGEGGLKIYADVYIDDRNLGGFLGWTDAMQKLGYPPLT